MNKYDQLIGNLSLILSSTSIDSAETSDSPIQLMKNYFKKDLSVVDLLIEATQVHTDLTLALNSTENTKTKMLTAQLSIFTSLIFLKVMSEISPVDHVEKYRLKSQYIEEDIELFDTLLTAYYLHGLVSGTITDKHKNTRAGFISYLDCEENKESLMKVHPYCRALFEIKRKTADKIDKYKSQDIFRTKEPSYNNFVKVCRIINIQFNYSVKNNN